MAAYIHTYETPKKFRIKKGYEAHGKQGDCFGYIMFDQKWAIVKWEGEEDPDLHKLSGLEEQTIIWRALA